MYWSGPTAGEMLFALVIFCGLMIGVGWGLNELAEWLWPIVKAWLHSVTA